MAYIDIKDRGVRTTIQLDDEIVDRLRRFVPNRGMNQFIAEAVTARLSALERSELELTMKEGYSGIRQARRVLNTDWAAAEVESWPE